MKLELYPCFEYLKKFNNIWIYSDPHFADREIAQLRKNYVGDDEQVKRINSKVGKKDVIFFLGDIGDIEYIKKIKGYKILIMGNHDAGSTNYTDIFDEIYKGIVCLNSKIVLSHEPISLPFMFNIHGHDHGNKFKKDNLHLNACAEFIDYTPINLVQLVKNGLCKDVTSIHRFTIDAATERVKKKNLFKK